MVINLLKISFSRDTWIVYCTFLLGAIVLGFALSWVLFWILKLSNRRKSTVLKLQLLKHLKQPTIFFLSLMFLYSSFNFIELNTVWYKIIQSFIIINFSWILIASLNIVEEIVKQKFIKDDNHKSKDRKVLTQLRFLKSISMVIIFTIAVAAILWNIPDVKKIGTTILTSAGVIGIIAGVAAQKSIANLITGFQIAFTQPIKIDDEVEIKGEFGTVEDITLTYVVIKTWDWRRLVLPLNFFSDNSFVNWTFSTTDLIGSVYIYVDYTFPVEELRKKLNSLLEENSLWDKQVGELLVTKSDQYVIELRATFSAKDASDTWALRCEIREKLIKFIQENYPNSLPKLRRMEVIDHK